MRNPRLSIVVPAYNEEESLGPLYERVVETFGGSPPGFDSQSDRQRIDRQRIDRQRIGREPIGREPIGRTPIDWTPIDWELIFVDDGSTDRTSAVVGELVERDCRVRGLSLHPNSGQTTAIRFGIAHARGTLIATIDGDLQNDPSDLPAMIDALGSNGAVVGFRIERNDTWWRRISSRIANGIRNRVTGDFLNDTGCSLKLFRADALREIPLVEGMHRFLPTLLRIYGHTVIEHPVSHRPRVAGCSKYGTFDRAIPAAVDLLAVRWLASRTRLPEVSIPGEAVPPR